jgi:hypothetical protein
MDPGNWATDLAAGSGHGYLLLSVVLLSSLMAMPLQILSARLGIGSGKDLAYLLPRVLPEAGFADAVAARRARHRRLRPGRADRRRLWRLHLLFGLPLVGGVLLASADAILILYLQDKGLCRLEAVVIGLIVVVAACLGIVLAMAPPEGAALARGLVPDPRIFTNPELLYLAIGIVGATVMPHNIYLQSWLVKDAGGADKKAAIRTSSACTIAAMSLAFFVNAAILVVAASVFHQAGRADVTDIRDAYTLLSPLVGRSRREHAVCARAARRRPERHVHRDARGPGRHGRLPQDPHPGLAAPALHAAARTDPGAVRGRPWRRWRHRIAAGAFPSGAERAAAVRTAAALAFRRLETRHGRVRRAAGARRPRLGALLRADRAGAEAARRRAL